MSGFGTENPDVTHAHYTAVFTHTNGATVEIISVFEPGTQDLDPTDMDAAWAAAIAVLDADAAFTYVGGDKTYSAYKSYTL